MPGMLKKIVSLFKTPEPHPARPRPPWPEIVEIMYEKSPSGLTDDEIVKVIYSADREKRLILFKSNALSYHYRMERLKAFDDEEWAFVSRDPDALPAIWGAFGYAGLSLFGTEQEAWRELSVTPEYKTYFMD